MSSNELSHLSRQQLESELIALRRREKLFSATEHFLHTGHYVWCFRSGKLLSCTQEYANLFNLSIEETLQRHKTWEAFWSYIHPDDQNYYRGQLDLRAENRELDVKYRIVLPDGEIKSVHEYSVVTNDDEKTGLLSYGMVQDISSQVRYAIDLEYREELSRQAESITDIGHFIFDEKNEKYLYVSEGFSRIHGVSTEKYLASKTSVEDDLSDIHAEDRLRVKEEYRHYVEFGGECAIEYRLIRDDGVVRWIREIGKAYKTSNGRVTQTIGVLQDITDTIDRERELLFKNAMAAQAESIADIGYFLFDKIKNKHLYLSPGLAKILEMDIETCQEKIVTNQDFYELIHIDDRDHVKRSNAENFSGSGQWELEYRLEVNHQIKWIREFGLAYQRGVDQIEQTIGILQDISSQKRIEEELLFKDLMANQAESITKIGHYIYDEILETYIYASQGLAKLHGLTVDELIGGGYNHIKDLELIHEDDRENVARVYDEFMINPVAWQVEYRMARSDGVLRWIREVGKIHVMNGGIAEQTIGVMQDITESKLAQEELIKTRDTLEQQVVERTRELGNTVKQLREEIQEREKVSAELDFLANHDALTGLPSLRLCKDRLDRSLADSRRNQQMSAVMFLDLDGFKQVNDSYGHDYGDQVLQETAKRIQAELRETDTVARIGGDEFVIILSRVTDAEVIHRIANSLVERISSPIIIEEKNIVTGASIGIAIYPEDGSTSEELIRQADKAMYLVKHSGKNNFSFSQPDRNRH